MAKFMDLTGKKYNKLTALEYIRYPRESGRWLCECECGRKIEVKSYDLTHNKVKSCGYTSCGGHKIESLLGQKFGYLLVVEEGEVIDQQRYWKCQCDCGNEIFCQTHSLISGNTKSCGCLQKKTNQKNLDKKRQANIGLRIGMLTIKEFVGVKDHLEALYKFECDCGNTFIKSLHQIRSNKTQNCGCVKAKEWQALINDFIGKRFGKLEVIEYAGRDPKYNQNLYKCRCDCGKITTVLRQSLLSGNTRSCGCTRSYGEQSIRTLLETNNLEYVSEYTFPDLKSAQGGALRYDFAIIDKEHKPIRLIEFDGCQHEKAYEFFGGEAKFQQVQESDRLKNEYALTHNIPLIRIPYNQRDKITIDMLLGDEFLIKASS